MSLTALWTAAQRARESARPDRLLDDTLAGTLAGPEGARMMEIMDSGQQPSPTVAIRSRYFDDRLIARTSDGARQIVLVGAGMDSRAFRLGLAADVTVFEIDQPDLLALKDQRLARAGARPTCVRRVVACDLDGAWADALRASGFSTSEQSVFVAEGLLMYLDEAGVERLLGDLSRLASPGSSLLADVCGQSFRDSPYMTAWFAAMERAGMAWRFGTDEPEALLAPHGWRADVVRYGDEGAHFGRWAGPRVDRHDLAWPHSYLVDARRLEE